MARYGDFIKELEYADSELPTYLHYDNWEIIDGLLLLTGLSPKGTDIEYETFCDSEFFSKTYVPYQVPIKKVNFVPPLTADILFSSIHNLFVKNHRNYEKTSVELELCLNLDISDEQTVNTLNIIEKELEYYKRKFLYNISIWYSGDHWDREARYFPIKDFIKWAEEKKIHVPWLDWAKKNGMLKWKSTKEKSLDPRVDPRVDPRSETTYLTIIGALLEFISGKGPWEKKHPDFESEAKLIDKFHDFEIRGLKKSTLENKFAEAKRTYKSMF